MHADPDLVLVRACQEADPDRAEAAFEALYQRYRDRVYSIAHRITGRSADAMDVLQEAFSLLFRKIGGFRSDALFSTWLFRIVVNCSVDHVRQKRQRHGRWGHSLEELEDGPAHDANGPMASAVTREVGEQVQACIARLSPKLRAVLALRHLEGLSYEELAATLNLSMGTVKSRLARAHAALEDVLRRHLPGYEEWVEQARPATPRGGSQGAAEGGADVHEAAS